MTDNATLKAPLTQAALDQLFYDARSQNGWLDRPVAPEVLEKLWEMASLGRPRPIASRAASCS